MPLFQMNKSNCKWVANTGSLNVQYYFEWLNPMRHTELRCFIYIPYSIAAFRTSHLPKEKHTNTGASYVEAEMFRVLRLSVKAFYANINNSKLIIAWWNWRSGSFPLKTQHCSLQSRIMFTYGVFVIAQHFIALFAYLAGCDAVFGTIVLVQELRSLNAWLLHIVNHAK